MDMVKICPKCGAIHPMTNGGKCEYCGTLVVDSDTPFDDYYDFNNQQKQAFTQKIENFVMGNLIFDETAMSKRFKVQRENKNVEQHQPKCPTCGSTNVTPISGLERGVSVGMLGIFSKKINKSFKCSHCGYTW